MAKRSQRGQMRDFLAEVDKDYKKKNPVKKKPAPRATGPGTGVGGGGTTKSKPAPRSAKKYGVGKAPRATGPGTGVGGGGTTKSKRPVQDDSFKSVLAALGGVRTYPVKKVKEDGKGGLIATAGSALDKIEGVPVVGTVVQGNKLDRAARNAVLALADDPEKTSINTLKGGRDIAAGMPAAIVAAATTRPDKTAKKIADDYQRRYGQSSAEQRKRFKEEGLAPELLDATLVATAGGATVGRGITAAQKSGALGPQAAARAARPRPNLRTSGGRSVPQPKSRNYFVSEAQMAKDARRAAKQRKQVTEARAKDARAPLLPARAEVANARAGRVVEVAAPKRIANKAQRVEVARLKSAAVSRRRSEQARIIDKGAARALNQLSKPERLAFAYVAEGRVTAQDAAKATAQLGAIRDGIVKYRAENAIDMTGATKKTDELRVIDELLANADKAFTPKLAQTVRDLKADNVKVGRADPRLNAEQRLLRRYAPQAETLGITRGAPAVQREQGALGELYRPDETTTQYIQRVKAAADAEGLETPLYFPGEKYALSDAPDRAAFAVGGARAQRPAFESTGELMRSGRRDVSPEVYLTGLARNIKATRNWELIRDTVEAGTFEGLRNMTIGELRQELQKQGIREADVRFWNPRLYADAMEGRGRTFPERTKGSEADELAISRFEGDEIGQGSAHDALVNSTIKTLDTPVKTSAGWSAIPVGFYDEIMESTRPSSFAGRSYDIVKGKQSRLMLGAGNIPWLAFQGVSNTMLGSAATKGRLAQALVKQHSWYRSLEPSMRDQVDALVGETGAASSGAQLTRLGATSDHAIVNQYRALKDNPIWDRPLVGGRGPSARQINPIEAMFMLDRAQNTVFRRAVLYDSLKREAFSDMGRSVLDVRAAQPAVIAAMEGKLRNPDAVLRHGQHLDDWLGNWTTFTSRERKVAQRAIMFYPFMRFSLKLAFRTLPAKHPIAYSLALKLGQLQQEELKKLGVDGLPWGKGRLYFTRNGELQQVDLGRANPVMNSALSLNEASQVPGMAPPMVGMAVDQLTHRNNFKDRDWRVRGENFPAGKKGSEYGLIDRARVLADDIGSLAFPYRETKKRTQTGPQGDDSLLGSPRPTKYKDPEILKSIEKTARNEDEAESLLNTLLPILGQSAESDVDTAERMTEEKREKEGAAQKRKQKKVKPKGYGVSGYGGGYGTSTYGGGYGP